MISGKYEETHIRSRQEPSRTVTLSSSQRRKYGPLEILHLRSKLAPLDMMRIEIRYEREGKKFAMANRRFECPPWRKPNICYDGEWKKTTTVERKFDGPPWWKLEIRYNREGKKSVMAERRFKGLPQRELEIHYGIEEMRFVTMERR